MENNLKKNFIWNMLGSTFASFISLFFMIIVTRINGVNEAGLFTFAFSTACLFYIIGIYSGRTFQVTDDSYYATNSNYFYSKIVTCLLMIIFSILFCILKKYSLSKSIIIFSLVFFKCLEAFSECLYAIIQKENKLYQVGKSLFIKALISVLLFLIIDIITKNLLVSIISIIIVNLFVIIFYDFYNLRNISFKLNKLDNKTLKNIKLILFSGIYIFLFSFLTQYVINAPRYAIDSILNNKVQTLYGILIMPSTIVVLLGQFIIQPFLLKLKESLNNKKEFLKMTIKLLLVIICFGIIILLCAYFLGIFFLELLYGIDLSDHLFELMIILTGAVIYGLSLILSTALTTMRSTLSQLIAFIIVSVFCFISSNIFVLKYGLFGASLTYFLSMVLLLLLYIIIFIYVYRKYGGEKNEKR